MNTKEALDRQNPRSWEVVVDGDGPYRGGLYCGADVTLALRDYNNNDVSFTFFAGQFVPLDIKMVLSGATGNGVVGMN